MTEGGEQIISNSFHELSFSCLSRRSFSEGGLVLHSLPELRRIVFRLNQIKLIAESSMLKGFEVLNSKAEDFVNFLQSM